MTAKITEHPSSARARQCRQLAKVLVDSKAMLECAQLENWEKVADMEKQRRAEMAECFTFKVGEDDSGLVAEALAAILHINDELMVLLRASRKKVMAQGEQMARSKDALNSYLDVGSATG